MNLTEKDLAAIRDRAEAATPGPWEYGERWHIQGASHCQCLDSHGPLIHEGRMVINGTMMQTHVHEAKEPFWKHGIHVAPSEQSGWHVLCVVNDTAEYGYMDDADAEFIAAARSDVPALVAEVKRLRAGIEALVTRYRTAWDEDGDTEAHAYAEDLLNLLDPTEGKTDD